MFIRVAFFFEASPPVRLLALILGGLTALLAAFTAIFVYDIKRIIAYSTCSQLGFILVACGLSQYTLGLFHLINHAFFKALLFLTAGAIIHTFSNEQDIRKLAGLFTRAPFIYAAILIGNISIIGLPFLSGFYSKDLIIEVVYLKNIGLFGILSVNLFFVSIIIATICTAIYSFRLHYFLFLRAGVYNYAQLTQPAIEQPFFIRFVLSSLIIGSIISGYVLSDIFSVTNNFFYFWSSPDYTRNIIS